VARSRCADKVELAKIVSYLTVAVRCGRVAPTTRPHRRIIMPLRAFSAQIYNDFRYLDGQFR
jgi:hypothetical protein